MIYGIPTDILLSSQVSLVSEFKKDLKYRLPAPISEAKVPMFELTLEELELSVRSANCLQNANIKYIYELVSKTEGEMLRTKNFGRKSLNEIKEILSIMGLGLGMKVDSIMKQVQENN